MALFVIAAPVFAQAKSPWGDPIVDLGGAEFSKEGWFKFQDYPTEALRKNIEGRVVVAFNITADGRAKDCKVAISSGHRVLDNTPCRPLERNARFLAAKAEDGTPRATMGRLSIDFWLPKPPQ